MQFDKPKVTIDLEEYILLKKNSEKVDKDDRIEMSKEIIAVLASHNDKLGVAIQYLKSIGIDLSIRLPPPTARMGNISTRILAEDIFFTKTTKQ